tara:strand:- start:4925 stop:5437 length:513 start_codon:yes stop_codon:yes gene_type:complete
LTNCKQLNLPPLDGVDLHKMIHFFKLGNHLFTNRYSEAPHWKSFDLIKDSGYSPMFKHFPIIVRWVEMLQREKFTSKIMNLYVSVLAPKQQIPWHVDMSRPGFNKAFITALQTDNSFIEFKDDKKYFYKVGCSYALQTGTEHRIINMSDDFRIALCTLPSKEINDDPMVA